MRSAAKLTYEEAQAAIDGQPNGTCRPLLDSVLKPLWAAYAALAAARDRREPLLTRPAGAQGACSMDTAG